MGANVLCTERLHSACHTQAAIGRSEWVMADYLWDPSVMGDAVVELRPSPMVTEGGEWVMVMV